MLANENVSESPMLEQRVMSLYNYVFGQGGQRGVELFQAVQAYLATRSLVSSIDDMSADDEAVASFTASVTAMSRMIEVNTEAQTVEAFKPIVEALSAQLENTPASMGFSIRKASRHVDRMKQRLRLGAALPDLAKERPFTAERPRFNLMKELPGDLSEEGPRHDNDNIDIRRVSILPTEQEIHSSRTEYLPVSDPTEWHIGGLEGLLDRNFRLLREDTVGPLRDGAKPELERLQNPTAEILGHHQKPKRRKLRTNVYEHVQVAGIAFDSFAGMEFALEFDQPQHLRTSSARKRREWWESTKRLGPDTLVCLLGSDGSSMFFVVSQASKHKASKEVDEEPSRDDLHDDRSIWHDAERARIVVHPANPDEALTVLRRVKAGSELRYSVIEFPGVLLPAFLPTLQAMQRMSETLDMPFTKILAPVSTVQNPDRLVELEPPSYATRPGFSYDLSPITYDNEPISFTIGSRVQETAEKLEKTSSLDSAQAQALVMSLAHSLWLIQGPPGTGKSYTGVGLIRVLLGNKKKAQLGPILCVTFTNHALDQGLERLIDEGVTQIVRMGGRSKSDKLANLNLRVVSDQLVATKAEKSDRYEAKKRVTEQTEEINQLLNRLDAASAQPSIEIYLQFYHEQHYVQLFGNVGEDGFKLVDYHRNNILERWLRSGLRNLDSNRSIETLQNVHVNAMSTRERSGLYEFWVAEIEGDLQNRLRIAFAEYNEAKNELHRIKTEHDLRALRQADVIGVTTSGLARNLDLLRRIKIKVLICEEAGEVLEPHQLTALLPSVEHAILIGDHEQLRPNVQNYDLSIENRRGAQYGLDISLFERLVRPSHQSSQTLSYSTLETQRRMHPTISQLVRNTLYPRLQDAENVQSYPPVPGLRQRMFWMHHEQPEDGGAEGFSTSHTNDYECEMVAALVNHLVKQGEYSSQDIAVITPYLGQLRKIRAKLAQSFNIVLNDRDEADLANEDDLSNASEADTLPVPKKEIARGTLLQALRAATVDNFQGEEAKVVVVSLVRSNAKNDPGFLRTTNRINVLLSRAQHGMYIFGNRKTTSPVQMWADVLAMFDRNNLSGDSLDLCCPRHPDVPMTVRNPDDFLRMAAEGGCDLKCDKKLDCGHACVAKCHSDLLHSAVYCTKPCTRPRQGCTHNCPLACGDKCHEYCQELIQDISLVAKCGHEYTTLPCYQYQDPSKIKCNRPKDVDVPGCGHKVTIPCYVYEDSDNFRCPGACSAVLPCGHECKKQCHQCNKRDANGELVTEHGKCRQTCDRDYSTCRHRCRSACHEGEKCPPCEAECEVRCSHSKCDKKCFEPCAPCAEEHCDSHCPHSACKMPCAAPCDWLPCSFRCTLSLACGCQCPSVCGELCPSEQFCQKCSSDEIKSQQVDFIEMTQYGDVDLGDDPCIFTKCGHIFTLSTMDGHMGMSQYYATDDLGFIVGIKSSFGSLSSNELKACIACRGSLRNIARYGRIVRRALLDETMKRLAIWSNYNHHNLAEELRTHQEELFDTVYRVAKLKQNIVITGSLEAQLKAVRSLRTGARYVQIVGLHQRIRRFAEKLHFAEQPYQRVQDMVETARRQTNTSDIHPFDFENTELQHREDLQARSLLIRCHSIIISDIIHVHMKTPPSKVIHALDIDLEANRLECEELIEAAGKTINILQEIEGRIFWADFAALEDGLFDATREEDAGAVTRSEQRKEKAFEHLRLAEELCEKLPNPPASLQEEIAEKRRMLSESSSLSDLKMAVGAMASDVGGWGRWYRCTNGHAFVVGECGRPMEESTCPSCGAGIGGRNHQATEGVEDADDITNMMRDVDVNR